MLKHPPTLKLRRTWQRSKAAMKPPVKGDPRRAVVDCDAVFLIQCEETKNKENP
jgi:hypothetical protein